MRIGIVVTGTKEFYDPTGEVGSPIKTKPLDVQIAEFCNDPKNNVVNVDKINIQQTGTYRYLMIYQKFVDEKNDSS